MKCVDCESRIDLDNYCYACDDIVDGYDDEDYW